MELTQKEIAEALGIRSDEFIGMMERGTRKPHFDRIPPLAKVLDTTPRHLFEIAMRDACPKMAKLLFGIPSPPPLQPSTLTLLLKIEALVPSNRRKVVLLVNSLYREQTDT